MRLPLWERSAGALEALLNPSAGEPVAFITADLWTFTLANGLTLRYATAPVDIGYDPGTGFLSWSAGGPRIDADQSRATFHWKRGLDVDTAEITIFPRPYDDLTGEEDPDKIGDTPWIDAARGGILDGVRATADRAYIDAWPPLPPATPFVPVGVYRLFGGMDGGVTYDRTSVTLALDSLLALLNTQMPRNLFQLGCGHVLYGAGCNVAGSLPQASFAVPGTALGGSDQLHIVTAGPAVPGSGTLALGQVKWTSGRNAGLSEMITAWDGTTMTLRAPMPFTVATGDAFTAYPGCDKSKTACVAFGNLPNFGGEPDTPVPETAI